MSITTPALLFPAISLLMLAYTNKFLTLANIIRNLYAQYQLNPSESLQGQIKNLRKRIDIIKAMQATGVVTFLLCVIAMFLIFDDLMLMAKYFFGASLVTMMFSLFLSLYEIHLSARGLNLLLKDIEAKNK